MGGGILTQQRQTTQQRNCENTQKQT